MYTDSFLMFITTYKGRNAEELRNNDDKPRRFNTSSSAKRFIRRIVTPLCSFIRVFKRLLLKKKKKREKEAGREINL